MKEATINQRYKVIVPEHIADWDICGDWEVARFISMEQQLNQGDTLFDVGVEQGWQSVIYAQFVGGENMVLFEPGKTFWPNIRQTWEANHLPLPKAHFVGLVDSKTSDDVEIELYGWTPHSEGELTTTQDYRYLRDDCQRITLDKFVDATECIPDAITIDVEGAELNVLKGAEEILSNYRPKVWVSIHPELMKDYKATPSELYRFMEALGYEMEYLGEDHEIHGYWFKK